MKEAFGSTFMFRLIIIFIVVYVTFATIAVSYAKTYRLKNDVINILEQYQYNNGKDTNIIEKVDDLLSSSNYNYGRLKKVKKICTGDKNIKGEVFTSKGACITPNIYSINKTKRIYFHVDLYMVIHIPGLDYEAIIPVGGDTVDVKYYG